MKLNKFLAIIISLGLLVGCSTQEVKDPEPKIVYQYKYISCDIPDKYFIGIDKPTRDWDWSQKNESDVFSFIIDNRTVIDELNDQISDIKKIYDNCKTQETNTNGDTNR